MIGPGYGDGKKLRRPEGYRHWMFVGANLGMGYSDAPRSEPAFHNIYIQPQAYAHYAKSGEFPDGTMLVMEVLTAGTNQSINRQGHFEDRLLGVEVAVKDSAKFPEKWAYFNFIGSDGKALGEATPLPQDACWKCHHRHGAKDNVFVQFYPVLRDAR